MLKIKFWRIENSIAMKVMNQGEEIKRGDFEFEASNGIIIRSSYRPQIVENYLYVRGGDVSFDDRVISYDFYNVATSKKQLALYLEAIEEYNKTLSSEGTDNMEIVVAE